MGSVNSTEMASCSQRVFFGFPVALPRPASKLRLLAFAAVAMASSNFCAGQSEDKSSPTETGASVVSPADDLDDAPEVVAIDATGREIPNAKRVTVDPMARDDDEDEVSYAGRMAAGLPRRVAVKFR